MLTCTRRELLFGINLTSLFCSMLFFFPSFGLQFVQLCLTITKLLQVHRDAGKATHWSFCPTNRHTYIHDPADCTYRSCKPERWRRDTSQQATPIGKNTIPLSGRCYFLRVVAVDIRENLHRVGSIGTVDTVSKVGTTFRLVLLPPTPPQAVDIVTCHLPHRIIIEVSDSASVKFAGRLPRGDSVIFIAGGWYIYDHIWYTDTSKEVILNLSAINLELGVDSKLDCKITLASLGASSAFIRFLRFYPYGFHMCSEKHASVCRKHFLGPCVDAATQRCNTAAYHCQRGEMAHRVWDFGCDVGGPNAFRQPWRCQCLNICTIMHQYRRIVFILKRTKGTQTLSKPWLFSIL